MNKNNLEFSVKSVKQNSSQSFIVFEINQVSSFVRKTNVGQFIKSFPFELSFPTSIGKSKWIVLIFLNGQYEADRPDNFIHVYLKMLQCEHQSAEFKFDCKFQLGSEYLTTMMKDQRLCFDDVRRRWIGTKLLNINEMIMDRSRLIQDDTLLLSVHLDEQTTKHVSSAEMAYNNNYLIERESCVKAETKNIDLHGNMLPAEGSYYRNLLIRAEPYGKTFLPEYSMQTNGPVYNYYVPQIQNSGRAPINLYGQTISRSPGSTNASTLPINRNSIGDSNLNNVENMVENEFSDDENTVKSNDVKSSLRNSVTGFFKSWFGDRKPM